MANIIYLEIEDKTISRLAGNTFGRRLFDEQVANKYQEDEQMTIVFPRDIQDVAVSFIQGFFKKLVDSMGRDKVLEMVKIDACARVQKRIEDNL